MYRYTGLAKSLQSLNTDRELSKVKGLSLHTATSYSLTPSRRSLLSDVSSWLFIKSMLMAFIILQHIV